MVGCRVADPDELSVTGIRSRDDLGRRLRLIARIAGACHAACASEEGEASSALGPRHLTIAQIMLLVVLWALGAAAWRLAWWLAW
jgi:hypothetical protein